MPLESLPLKTCRLCGRTLPLSQFYRHCKSADGYQSICRSCMLSLRSCRGFKQVGLPANAPKGKPDGEGVMESLKSPGRFADKMIVSMSEYERLKAAGQVLAGPRSADEPLPRRLHYGNKRKF